MQEIGRKYSIKKKKLVNKTTFSLVLLVTATLLLSGSVAAMDLRGDQQNMNDKIQFVSGDREICEVSPNIHSEQITQVHNQQNAIWDIQIDFDVEIASGAPGNAGAEWDGTYFYSTRWASNLLHKYDASGNLVEEFSIAGVSGLRDLAFDGTYMWGGNGGGTLWKMDFATQTLVQTFTGAFEVRAIAYDSDLDIIYASGWADPVYEIDPSDGSVLGTFNLGTTTSTYGMAYDAETTGGPYLWVFDQTNGGAIIYQWDLAAGAYTGVTHDVNGDFTNAGIAGGLFFCTDYAPGFATVGGISQGTPDIMVCYEIEQITQLEHDIGVVSIDSPSSGNAQVFTPEVKIKNYGSNTETSVPVQLTIGTTSVSATTLLTEDFEGTFPPTGWTVVNNNPPNEPWQRNDYWARTNYAGSGYCADADSDAAYPNYIMDTELISPSFSLDGSYDEAYVTFYASYNYLGSGEYADVDISINGGTTWVNLLHWTSDHAAYGPGEFVELDVSTYIGQSNVLIRWVYVSPGWNYWFMVDDIDIYAAGVTTDIEFDETEYVTSIAPGETVTVEYDDWAPDAWGTVENVDIDYDVSACQLLADDYANNDCKDKVVTLHYPYLHDIAVVSVDSPSEDGDAQTLPVQCTIKNVGQNPECCYQTKMEIGEVLGSFIDEDFSGGVPPSGWGTTHPSNWGSSATSNAGGTAPEARFSWTPSATADFRLYTGPMDTSGYTNMNLKFKEYVNDYNGDYTLLVETSTDGVNWMTAYSRAGGPYGPTTTVVPLDTSLGMGSSTLQVSFTFSGYSFNINYWYIDDVELKAPSIVEEYEDTVCTIELDPGEEAQLTFDDWTPDGLALGVSGPRDYMAIGTQMLSTDTNPANDMALAEFTLDYRHDVGVQAITEPSLGRNPDVFYAFDAYPGDVSVWFENTNPGVLNTIGPNTAPDFIASGTWADGTWYVGCYVGGIYTVDPNDGTMTLIGGSTGWNGMAYDGSTMYGATSTQLYEIDLSTGAGTLIGSFGLGGAELMIDIAIDHDTGICYGHDIVSDSIYTIDLSTGAATLLGSTGLMCNYAQGMEYDQDNDILYLSAYTTQGELYTCDTATGACTLVGAFQGGAEVCGLAIPYAGGGPGPVAIDVWVSPGTYPMEAIVENLGTFEETGLSCFADLVEFITDPNGTLAFEAQVDNIDLDPLGDEDTVAFGTYDFDMQGTWALYVDFPLGNDDKPNNNDDAIGIGVDDTAPTSAHSLDPATPDGENGWYVSDLTVTLTADDGQSTNGWQSGVQEIKYRIDGGSTQSIPGDSGSFVLSTDGEDIEIEYWAVDNVGNEEAHNFVNPVDMDQTVPTIDLKYEVTGGNALQGWEFTFTATATDAMSGMDYVEFYFNGVYQTVVEGEGPEYVWTIQYNPMPNAFVDAVGYDVAGNDASDRVDNPKSKNVQSLNQNTQSQQIKELVQNVQTLNNG